MDVQHILGSNTTSTSKTPGGAKTLDQDSFLKLLVAQLQHQDPSSNQDPNQMVQQITSFSSLDAARATNKLLEGIQTQNAGMFQAQAASMVGKQVKVTSSSFNLSGGKASVGVDLAADAQVTLTIKDSNGKVVQVLEQGNQKAGSLSVDWNGKDLQGNSLPEGTYTVAVKAVDAQGKDVTAATTSFLKVDAVVFQEGLVYLMAGGRRYDLSSVTQIAA